MSVMIDVKFVKTHENAVLPKQNNARNDGTADSGYDLTSVGNVVIPARGSAVVPVGLTLAYLQPGYWFRVEGRSGLGFKHGISPHQGIIDNMYRGDLGVKLYNLTDSDYSVSAGDRVAQMVFYPLITASVEFVDEVVSSERGHNGFGSSGK